MFGWRNRDRAVIGEVTTRPKCERGRRPIRTRGAWDERNTTKVTQGTYVACDEGILPGCGGTVSTRRRGNNFSSLFISQFRKEKHRKAHLVLCAIATNDR